MLLCGATLSADKCRATPRRLRSLHRDRSGSNDPSPLKSASLRLKLEHLAGSFSASRCAQGVDRHVEAKQGPFQPGSRPDAIKREEASLRRPTFVGLATPRTLR